MAAWVLWLVIAVVLGVADTATLTSVLGLLGGVALLTAGAGRSAAVTFACQPTPDAPPQGQAGSSKRLAAAAFQPLRHRMGPGASTFGGTKRSRGVQQAGPRRCSIPV